jgi:hypothetical protein
MAMSLLTTNNKISEFETRGFLNRPITDPMSTSVYNKYPFIFTNSYPGEKYAIKHKVQSQRGCNPSWQVLEPQPKELFNSLDMVNSNKCLNQGIMGPVCGPVEGVALQEQPPNMCTDLLPFRPVGCSMELEIWNPSSDSRKAGLKIGSKIFLFFKNDCVANVIFNGEVSYANYKWERAVFTGYATITLNSKSESVFGKNFTIELRSGTESYGTAYTPFGLANYQLLCTKKFKEREWKNSLYSLSQI